MSVDNDILKIPYVFISYAGDDDKEAEQVKDCLENAGFQVFFAPTVILPTVADFEKKLKEEMDKADYMVILFSKNSMPYRKYVDFEWRYFFVEKGKPLLPLQLNKCDKPIELEKQQYIDASKSLEKACDKLIKDLCKLAILEPLKTYLVETNSSEVIPLSIERSFRELCLYPPKTPDEYCLWIAVNFLHDYQNSDEQYWDLRLLKYKGETDAVPWQPSDKINNLSELIGNDKFQTIGVHGVSKVGKSTFLRRLQYDYAIKYLKTPNKKLLPFSVGLNQQSFVKKTWQDRLKGLKKEYRKTLSNFDKKSKVNSLLFSFDDFDDILLRKKPESPDSWDDFLSNETPQVIFTLSSLSDDEPLNPSANHIYISIESAKDKLNENDPRFRKGRGSAGTYLMPPMVNIPSGTYKVGTNQKLNLQYRLDKSDPQNIDVITDNNEYPQHPIDLKAFLIGEFPVTNAEYQHFINAGGYTDKKYWKGDKIWKPWISQGGVSDELWEQELSKLEEVQILAQKPELIDKLLRNHIITDKQAARIVERARMEPDDLRKRLEEEHPKGHIKEPRFWADSKFNNPLQPVVGISWYEAKAYCRWLSQQTGLAYQLPTEFEWEAAARGDDERPYPYGDDFKPYLCNTEDSHIQHTTPVDAYVNGKSPFGCMDMCGNSCDWTLNTLKSYEGTDETPYENPYQYILRGGSWYNSSLYARTTSRYHRSRFDRLPNTGFRVCISGG